MRQKIETKNRCTQTKSFSSVVSHSKLWAMLRIRLISFLILLSIVSLQAKEDAKAQKYFCRSNEDLAELDNSKIERLLIDKDVVYLFLPKKVLRFSMPYIFNTFKTVLANKTFTIIRPLNQTTQLNDTQPLAQLSNKTEPKGVKPFNPPMHLNDTKSVQHVIPENQTETVNITRTVQLTVIDETFVVSSQAFVLAGKGAAASENLIGYVSDNTADDKSLLFEFYRVTDSEPKYHSLKFDPKPGESDTEGDKRLNSKKVDPGPLSYLMDYYYYFQFNNNAIRVGLIYYKDGSTFAEITNFSGSVKKKSTKKSIRRGNETIRFAVYYEAPVKKPMELENSLVEVDTENFIHIHLTAFRNGQTQMHSSFKLSQFFGCHSKFERKDQVKGVLYDQKFYLFVNHHYLKFDDDLVELRFKIENKSYENGTDLDLGENFRFENYRTKWVRSFLSTAYLSILDQTFKIWVDQASGNLQFDSIKEQTLKGIMQNCTRQLLNVDQYVFCFEEKNYYPAGYLDSVPVGRSGNHSDLFLKRPIIELFKGGRVSYESNETLEFIFNYKVRTSIQTFFCFVLNAFSPISFTLFSSRSPQGQQVRAAHSNASVHRALQRRSSGCRADAGVPIGQHREKGALPVPEHRHEPGPGCESSNDFGRRKSADKIRHHQTDDLNRARGDRDGLAADSPDLQEVHEKEATEEVRPA